mgnify:CR=1 FL=1
MTVLVGEWRCSSVLLVAWQRPPLPVSRVLLTALGLYRGIVTWGRGMDIGPPIKQNQNQNCFNSIALNRVQMY